MKATIAVIVLGLVGIVVYVLINQSSSPASMTTSESVLELAPGEEMDQSSLAARGTIDDIIALGNVRCDYRAEVVYQDTVSMTEGVIYHDDNRVRVDSVVESGGGNSSADMSLDSSMILLDDILYTWSSMGAVKMSLDRVEQLEAEVSEQFGDVSTDDSSVQTSLFDQDIQYDCESWSVDASLFELPAGVEFIDMDELMETNLNQLEGMREMMEGMDLPELQ